MKVLLVCESRQGKLVDSAYELLAFADRLQAERAMFVVGTEAGVPRFTGKVYLADAATYGEYDPDMHKLLVIEAAGREHADAIVFSHSAYGWDLSPRVAASLRASLITEIVDTAGGTYEVPCFNSKMRRITAPKTSRAVLTIQAGAFNAAAPAGGTPEIVRVELAAHAARVVFAGYEAAQKKDLDLARAEVIVSAGRGVGKKENIPVIAALAAAFGGELGATRPVVDAGWLEYGHQVGSTGQIVSPKLYVACGISGAIQHLAGMKKSNFIVAINKDKDAPIGSVADVLVVVDCLQFVPVLTARLQK